MSPFNTPPHEPDNGDDVPADDGEYLVEGEPYEIVSDHSDAGIITIVLNGHLFHQKLREMTRKRCKIFHRFQMTPSLFLTSTKVTR